MIAALARTRNRIAALLLEMDCRDESADMQAWKRRAISISSIVLACLSAPPIVWGSFSGALSPFQTALVLTSLVTLMSVALSRRLSTSTRLWLITAATNVLAIAMLLRNGVFSSFFLITVISPIFFAILGTFRQTIFVALVNATMMLVAGLASEAGLLTRDCQTWVPGEWLLRTGAGLTAMLPLLVLVILFNSRMSRLLLREGSMVEQLRHEAALRERLESEVQEAAETESLRIGSELHDGVCQDLTGLLLAAKRIQKQGDGASSSRDEALAELAEGLSGVIGDLHGISRRLSPGRLVGNDLDCALAELVRRTDRDCPTGISFRRSGQSIPLNVTASMHLYRIAQEALANATRHSGATRISVSLENTDDMISLTVQDDGRGLTDHDHVSDGVGLNTMEWRARKAGGTLTIDNTADGGLRVICRIPAKMVTEGDL